MTARILVVGSERWADSATVETVLQRAYLNLRAERPVLVTMGREGAEQVAETFWTCHGWPSEPHRQFGNKYSTLNSYLTSDPDLVLVFVKGDDHLPSRAADLTQKWGMRAVVLREE